MVDLFGGETPIIYSNEKKSKMWRWTHFSNYRKAEGKERCKNCIHFIVKNMSNKYFKCEMLGCTASYATDIRANHVCKFHKYED